MVSQRVSNSIVPPPSTRDAASTTASGAGIASVNRHGQPIDDDDFLILFNAHHEDTPFRIPELPGKPWNAVIDTAKATGVARQRHIAAGAEYPLRSRSLVVLQREAAP